MFSFDVDAEAPILAEDHHYAEDLSAMSHQAHGPRVGVPRILDLLALHGYSHRVLPEMTREEQRRDLELGLQALAHGIKPHGFRAHYLRMTRATLDLLARHDILYDSSLMDDRPYRLMTASGIVAELPVYWPLDDREQYAFLPGPEIGQQIEIPRKVVELWTAELDAMRETNSLCVLVCHPFLSGRPSRLRAIDELSSSRWTVATSVSLGRTAWQTLS